MLKRFQIFLHHLRAKLCQRPDCLTSGPARRHKLAPSGMAQFHR